MKSLLESHLEFVLANYTSQQALYSCKYSANYGTLVNH